MRVFSTFSGISAATAAWKRLGFEFVGYCEPEAFQSLVLSERCGATKPRYLPDYRTIMEAVCREVFADYARPEILMEWQAAFAGRDWNDPDFDFPDSFAEMVLEGWGQRQPAADEMMRRDETARKNTRVKAWPRGRVPNFGDLSQITDDDLLALGPVDILEGGSPCQAFSIAGKRLGLDDYRGNLTLQFVELAYRMQKLNGLKYVVWENVKGVLDARKGNGFGCLLGALAEKQGGEIPAPGKRWTNAGMVSGPNAKIAWRVLDAQYFGVPQRRERVFLVASLGKAARSFRPEAVLLERRTEGDGSSKRRTKRQPAAGTAGEGAEELVIFMAGQGPKAKGIAASFTTSPTLKASPSGSNMVPTVAYRNPAYVLSMDSKASFTTDISPPIIASAGHNPPVVVHPTDRGDGYVVRKITALECERLMGFPDGWTDVAMGNWPTAESRKRSCGNAMAVPVMRWIGERILREAGATAQKAAPQKRKAVSAAGHRTKTLKLKEKRQKTGEHTDLAIGH